MFNWLADLVIAIAKRTPYGHLTHSDGTPYMNRWWLFSKGRKKTQVRARVHHICTPDGDRHNHDHPWTFISLVMKGWYTEARPETIEPCFFDCEGGKDLERYTLTYRGPGSIALRRATDRHRILAVSPGGVWTLVIVWPKSQWWGFFTPQGKIHWKNYESVHGRTEATVSESYES